MNVPQRLADTTAVIRDDILRAVKSLKPLGSDFAIVIIGKQQMIRSVPKELNPDQSTVLEACRSWVT